MKRTLLSAAALTTFIAAWALAQSTTWAGAQWIWDEANANNATQNNEPRYLRLPFTLSAKPTKAELWITVDNHYVAYVNGQKVGQDAEWSTVEHIDVAKHLVVGKNVLAIKATNQGGVAGAIARLIVKTDDKKEIAVVTNDKTKVSRTEEPGWNTADFNDTAWFNAIPLGDVGIGPWSLTGGVAKGKGKGKGKAPATQFGYNTTEVVPVKGRLTPQEQIKHFVVPKDFEIELVAADPLVINPITMVLDDKGRIIVSESHTYRYGPKGSPVLLLVELQKRLDILVENQQGISDATKTGTDKPEATPKTRDLAAEQEKLAEQVNFLQTAISLQSLPTIRESLAMAEREMKQASKDLMKKAFAEALTKQEGSLKNLRLVKKQVGELVAQIAPLINPVIRLDPDGKGGFTRTLIADGFADPVMGIAVKGDKLWLTACNYLYTYDLPEASREPKRPEEGPQKQPPPPGANTPGSPTQKPLAINKKTIVTDLTKAWNPFGMFVLEWGPDGKLYMSVGNHAINLQSPDSKMSGRGSSGIIVRMNPDGTKMERLVHGLRVPYSFEYDPFGQLWLLSNGEGNPNRFVRVIDGVDYHCYSRPGVGNDWLAGKSPLAPPCEELHRGADTQLMRYYGAAYPQEYQGNLFLCNWGAHGFAGNNRGIFRFVPDERNNIAKREPLVWCKDPHFRPAHIHLDVDGSLLIADWYGRDDESDMTGRIWRLKYVGKNAPVVKHKLDSPEWSDRDFILGAMGSPNHLVREKAIVQWQKRNNRSNTLELGEYLIQTKEPLGAVTALWTLVRMNTVDSLSTLVQGTKNPDWRVRRLALNLQRRYTPDLVKPLASLDEKNPAVTLENAIANAATKSASQGLLQTLANGAASDPHLRYEVAWHLAKHADEKTITQLLTADDADVRLAGLIAIDVACYENFPTKKAALEALSKALENPGKLDQQLLLEVARLDGDASIVPGLLAMLGRNDLPAATIAKAVLILKTKSGGSLASAKLNAAAGKRLIEAIEKGQLKIATPADQLVMFEFLEAEGPTPFALKQIAGQLQSKNKELSQAAHTLARRFGPKASSLSDQLWPIVFDPKTKFEDSLEYLSTIARTESKPSFDNWKKGLFHADPFIRAETVRWWRNFKNDRDLQPRLSHNIEYLSKKDRAVLDDIAAVYRHWGWDDKQLAEGSLPIPERDKAALTKYALSELTTMPASDRAKRAAMGLQVFERNACTKCHTSATATTPLAPSLKGVAGQKLDYLIESVLYPSKTIKTGWEVEVIELKSGKVITGLAKDDGKALRVIQAMDFLKGELRIDKAEIEARQTSKISLMPEGQEAMLSRREFVDLIAYLQTLK